ncbi:MAG: putative competence protein [Pseudobdellovibrio sp.]|nr:putative competence protein [Pseudobdellovibrio sp.]
MILIFSLVILLFIFSFFRFSVLGELKSVVEFAHRFCLEQIPTGSNSIPELKALVCAENFSNLQESNLYISSGLIHLFVVSGAHLLFIEKSLQNFNGGKKFSFAIIFTVLFAYSLMCAMNPPVTRCLISIAFAHYLFQKNIRWPPHFYVFCSGIISLIINPPWIDSLSLQMSWLAAFTVSYAGEVFKHSALLRQFIFFLLLYPAVMWFQIVSPGIILANLFLGPALEFILFPVALLTWAAHPVAPVFDFLILCFKTILSALEFSYLPRTETVPPQMPYLNWALLLLLHLGAHLHYVRKKRAA